MDEEALVIGNTYFAVFYADEKLRIPEIQTLIYLGRDPSQDDERFPRVLHAFQRAWSFVNHGNWLHLTREVRAAVGEDPVIHFERGQMEPLCDAAGLLQQLEAWRKRIGQ